MSDFFHLDEKYPNILISHDLVVQDLVTPLVLTHDTEYYFSCFPEAACGDLDETHANYVEEKTQK